MKIAENTKIQGCLIGGAAGDALGYEIEFLSEDSIFNVFGENGITEYRLHNGKAEFSDDTQMTMFTAQGIIDANKTHSPLIPTIAKNYQDWLTTQEGGYRPGKTGLLDIPELFSRRAPGNTCLSVLRNRRTLCEPDSYIRSVINNSCGCGGVMRVAPIGFIFCNDIKSVCIWAAEAAAVTHSHELGYIPAAILAYIIHRCVYTTDNLYDIVNDAIETAEQLFEGYEHIGKQAATLRKAVELSENGLPDLYNIHALGEGWVGDEALNIAVYCALRHSDNFSDGIIAAVNHKGDSDSTGAICGNILGAYLGLGRIEPKWIENLELIDTLSELASQF